MNADPKTAFAIGGLGGNNAFGAGFIQAALRAEKIPLSCTSGQIYWAYQFLKGLSAAQAERDQYLRTEMRRFIESTESYHQRDLDIINLAIEGKPGMMHVAMPEMLFDTCRNAVGAMQRVFAQGTKAFVTRELWSELPLPPPCFCRVVIHRPQVLSV